MPDFRDFLPPPPWEGPPVPRFLYKGVEYTSPKKSPWEQPTAPLSYRGRYTLIAFKEGSAMGNVWEETDDLSEAVAVAKEVFNIPDGWVPALERGERVRTPPNLYETDYVQIIKRFQQN